MNDLKKNSVLVADLMARRISNFSNIHTTAPNGSATVRAFVEAVQRGEWKMPVDEIRRALQTDGKKAADKIKCSKLPAVTFRGLFERRAKDGLNQHSGLLVLDFDDLGASLESARKKLIADEHVLSVFVSPSGAGLKAVVAIDASDDDGHGRAFTAAEAHFKGIGLTTDPSGKDVCRLCFASHDANAWSRAEGSRLIILSALCTTAHSAPTALTAPSATTAPSARHLDVIERRRSRNALKQAYVNTPRLARIFQKYVESRPALTSQRNATLTQLVPSLYSVVSEEIALRFSLSWFDLNRAIFKDTREQHRRETEAMLAGVGKTYFEALTADARSLYELLDIREQAAFRICRDLASRGKDQLFFMSCDELGERLGCNSRQAHRILTGFVGDGLLDRTTLGRARALGVRPLATEWTWRLE